MRPAPPRLAFSRAQAFGSSGVRLSPKEETYWQALLPHEPLEGSNPGQQPCMAMRTPERHRSGSDLGVCGTAEHLDLISFPSRSISGSSSGFSLASRSLPSASGFNSRPRPLHWLRASTQAF